MPPPDFWIRASDTEPALEVRLLEGTTVKDLSGRSARFVMRDQAGAVVVDHAAAQVVNAAQGVCAYRWAGGDTVAAGRYFAHFHIPEDDESFPNYRELIIHVHE